ncbi:sigma-70 factor domain-containing protein [Nostoc sp. UIC 10607]|uniref:sigma-70 factor domain-containing protein n=1 Tax=Nostoc sp. UIC 10607 TaxID=3045935 RepID=UPI0039A28348
MSSQSSDPLGIYLREISRFEMLLPEQEIFYARQVKLCWHKMSKIIFSCNG